MVSANRSGSLCGRKHAGIAQTGLAPPARLRAVSLLPALTDSFVWQRAQARQHCANRAGSPWPSQTLSCGRLWTGLCPRPAGVI